MTAKTIRVRNVGPHDLEIRPGGQLGDAVAVVPADGVVEIGAALAGRVPSAWARLGDEEAIADDGRQYRAVDGGWEVRDPGAGLLAQESVWAVDIPVKTDIKADTVKED